MYSGSTTLRVRVRAVRGHAVVSPRPTTLRQRMRHRRHCILNSAEAHPMRHGCGKSALRGDMVQTNRTILRQPENFGPSRLPRGVFPAVRDHPKIWRHAQDARWLPPFNYAEDGDNRVEAFRRPVKSIAWFSDSTVVYSWTAPPVTNVLQKWRNRSSGITFRVEVDHDMGIKVKVDGGTLTLSHLNLTEFSRVRQLLVAYREDR